MVKCCALAHACRTWECIGYGTALAYKENFLQAVKTLDSYCGISYAGLVIDRDSTEFTRVL